MKTTDWLIQGAGGPERAEKIKAKAIKQAGKELARIKKNENKKSIRAYRKMYKRHRKEMIKLAKEDRDFDWAYLHDLVLTKIEHMYEYYSAGNNVFQTEETLQPILESLKYVIDLQKELDGIWLTDTRNEDDFDNIDKLTALFKREDEIYKEMYAYIGQHLREWWD